MYAIRYCMSKKTHLDFIDRLRGIAQTGLNHATDPHDKANYTEILALVAGEYAHVAGLAQEEILKRFQKELGYITPKVGVNGALFRADGTMLLERRADDGTWGVPGGWVDVGESPSESMRREFLEETGLHVTDCEVVQIFSRTPGEYDQPHSSCHILYYCEANDGAIVLSPESLEMTYLDISTVTNWHRDHEKLAHAAQIVWNDKYRHVGLKAI